MLDMIGQNLDPGDLFLIPGGNPRFGGLILEIGIILSKTEKRLKTLTTKFDKINLKSATKTSAKVLKIHLNETLINHPAVLTLREHYLQQVS